jgi:hypothetical protein
MLGLRVILGTFEAGLSPSAVYLLSLCYLYSMYAHLQAPILLRSYPDVHRAG